MDDAFELLDPRNAQAFLQRFFIEARRKGEACFRRGAVEKLLLKEPKVAFSAVVKDGETYEVELTYEAADGWSGSCTCPQAYACEHIFAAMSALGWNVIPVADGNDLPSVYLAVERGLREARANPRAPVCLWVKTIKGFGVKSTMESASGGHGFPLANGEKIAGFVNEIYFGGEVPAELAAWSGALRADWEKKDAAKKAKAAAAPPVAPAVKSEKIQAGLGKGAVRAAQEGLPVYSVSADLAGSTGIAFFQKSFPGRFLDVGVAEANMISTAAGLAKAGLIPIVDTFGQFGVTKGNLPLTMSALSQAPDGASHEATTYIAATSAIPHTVVIACSCSDEAEALMHQAVKRIAHAREHGGDGESVIFFVGRENYPAHLADGARYEWGKAQILAGGGDVVIIACGPLLGRALEAGRQLQEQKIAATVISNPFVNRVDLETIGAAVRKCSGRVVTIEDHQAICGMGAQVAHQLSQAGIHHQMKTLAIRGEFGQSAYVAEDLYKKHGLTSDKIVEAARELMR